MAKCADTLAKPAAGRAVHRKVKVRAGCTYPDYQRVPLIRLKGKCLSDNGFTPGARVDVQATRGCIVLTLRPGDFGVPPPDHCRRQQLESTFCRLMAHNNRLGVIEGLKPR